MTLFLYFISLLAEVIWKFLTQGVSAPRLWQESGALCLSLAVYTKQAYKPGMIFPFNATSQCDFSGKNRDTQISVTLHLLESPPTERAIAPALMPLFTSWLAVVSGCHSTSL